MEYDKPIKAGFLKMQAVTCQWGRGLKALDEVSLYNDFLQVLSEQAY